MSRQGTEASAAQQAAMLYQTATSFAADSFAQRITMFCRAGRNKPLRPKALRGLSVNDTHATPDIAGIWTTCRPTLKDYFLDRH